MPVESILFLAFVIAVFGGFGLMLAYASWVTTGRNGTANSQGGNPAKGIKFSHDA